MSHIPAKHLPRFFRCPHCSGYYHREEVAACYADTYFDESGKPSFAGRAAGKILEAFLFLRERKIRRFIFSKSASVLDYGCGNGKLVAFLKRRGFSVEGYDPSPSAVSLAARADLPVFGTIPEKRYDLIMFWHSLEHSDQPLADFKNLHAHLADRGRVLIAVPNGDSLEAKLTGESWFCYDWPFHRVHFNERALASLLEASGFRILSVDRVNPEYTVSSAAQTFLNLLLPKNALYSVVSRRRGAVQGKGETALVFAGSLCLLALFFPLLGLVFLAELVSGRTAACIVVAERIT